MTQLREIVVFFTFIGLLIATNVAIAQGYVKVKAKSGDGVHTLLKRYDLDEYDCNVDFFYEKNDLKPNAKLLFNKEYYLPILAYDYNKKSIRSTLNVDLETALDIQRFNEDMLKAKYRKQSFLKDLSLWVPYHVQNCNDEVKKSNEAIRPAGHRVFPIFGENYEKVPLIDKSLWNHVYYIDAGHGGPDPGAMAKWNGKTICEDEYAYDISLRLTRILLQHGAIVYMITRDDSDGIRDEQYLPCDADEYCWDNQKIPINQKARLQQRANSINRLFLKHKKQGVKRQALLIIHIDSRAKREKADAFFYFQPGSEDGKKLATNIYKTFENNYEKYREYDGSVTARELFLLRESYPTSVYIELANINNAFDQQRIIQENNRQALANWLYEGLKE